MEKRGAQVVAIDVERIEAAEWPPTHRDLLKTQTDARGIELGRGFRIAHRELGSAAERIVCDVMALTPLGRYHPSPVQLVVAKPARAAPFPLGGGVCPGDADRLFPATS
jgi:hypothetical protein